MEARFYFFVLILLTTYVDNIYAQADELLLSEYVHYSSSNAFAVAIHNPTASTLDLSNYELTIQSNNNVATLPNLVLSGQLPSGSSVIVGNLPYCSTICSGCCDFSLQGVSVNGDDAIELTRNSILIDAINLLGSANRPQVNNVANALDNHYLQRLPYNCTRYTDTLGSGSNSWPDDTSTNFSGWKVQNPKAITGTFNLAGSAQFLLPRYSTFCAGDTISIPTTATDSFSVAMLSKDNSSIVAYAAGLLTVALGNSQGIDTLIVPAGKCGIGDTVYLLRRACGCPAPNLLFNGDFEQGDTGFSSCLTKGTTPATGKYWIDSNSSNISLLFSGKSISGQFMIIDGPDTACEVWQSKVSVQPNTYYRFAINVSGLSILPARLAEFALAADTDTLLEFSAYLRANQFLFKSASFFSGNRTSVSLKILGLTASNIDNEYAFDDLRLEKAFTVQPEILAADTVVACTGQKLTFRSSIAAEWVIRDSGLTFLPAATQISYTPSKTGSYWVKAGVANCGDSILLQVQDQSVDLLPVDSLIFCAMKKDSIKLLSGVQIVNITTPPDAAVALLSFAQSGDKIIVEPRGVGSTLVIFASGAGACTTIDTLFITVGDEPKQLFTTSSISLCEGGSTTFTHEDSGVSVERINLLDTTIAAVAVDVTSTAVMLTAKSAGITTLILELTKGACTLLDSLKITVDPQDAIEVVGLKKSYCIGDSVQLLFSGADSFTITTQEGQTVTVDSSYSIVATKSDTLTISGGSCGSEVVVNYQVVSIPVLTYSSTQCLGDTSFFTSADADSIFIEGADTSTNGKLYIIANADTAVRVFLYRGDCITSKFYNISFLDSSDLKATVFNSDPCAGEAVFISFSLQQHVDILQIVGSGQSVIEGTLDGYNIRFAEAGSYEFLATTTTNSCVIINYFSVVVKPEPYFALPSFVEYCAGDVLDLNDAYVGDSIRWPGNPDSMQLYLTLLKDTLLYPHVYSGGCVYADTVEVRVRSSPQARFNLSKREAVYPDEVVAENRSLNAVQFEWLIDGVVVDTTENYTLNRTSTDTLLLTLRVTNARGCSNDSSTTITFYEPYSLYVPSIFTPDNNGLNDTFRAAGIGFRSLRGNIYNRWGEQVYFWEHNTKEKGWDGRILGALAPEGVYLYLIETEEHLGKVHSHRGYFILAR